MMRVGVGHFSANGKVRELVNMALDNGRLSYGPISIALEKRFSEMHDCDYGVLSNSGTSSLQVALQAMKELYGWRDGDEVIVPSVTFVATLNVILHNKMVPVIVDVDPRTYNIDPEEVRKAVTSKTRCAIPVHLFGQPADVGRLRSILPDRVRIIEDSCECVGAFYQGRPVGSLGDIGCFSFYVAHILTAGVGGIAITNSPELERRMRSLVNHGRRIDYGGNIDIATNDDVRKNRFVFDSVGHSFRITELEAAVALGQIDGIGNDIIRRNGIAGAMTQHLQRYEDLTLPYIAPYVSHSFMMYPILYSGNKWKLCGHLERAGIETREMLPLTNQPVYKEMIRAHDYPVARKINRHGFYIGCHPGMTNDDVMYVLSVFDEYFR